MRIVIDLKQLPATLKKLVGAQREATRQGMVSAAHRGVNILRGKTPVGVSGQLKGAWRVGRLRSGADGEVTRIINDAPYAGIIENGCRPHPVNRAGIEAIALWVRRKFGYMAAGSVGPGRGRQGPRMNITRKRLGEGVAGPVHQQPSGAADREIMSIVWAIVQKLKTQGHPPTYFVKRSLPEIEAIMATEVEAALARVAAKGGAAG